MPSKKIENFAPPEETRFSPITVDAEEARGARNSISVMTRLNTPEISAAGNLPETDDKKVRVREHLVGRGATVTVKDQEKGEDGRRRRVRVSHRPHGKTRVTTNSEMNIFTGRERVKVDMDHNVRAREVGDDLKYVRDALAVHVNRGRDISASDGTDKAVSQTEPVSE